MKFDIAFERVYAHPIEKVWQALSNAQALGSWLMETDFVPEVGRDFEMSCDDGAGGTDVYRCKVLELEPPRRMLWSWLLEGREHLGETFVELRLEPVAEGTRLRIRHSGDRDPDTIEAFKSGWPHKLDVLGETLGR